MRSKLFSLLLPTVLLAAVALVALAVVNGQSANAAPKPQRYIVTFEDDVALNEAAKFGLAKHHDVENLKTLDFIDGLVVLVPDQAAIEKVGTLAGVRSIELDVQVYTLHHREGHDGGPGGGNPTPDPDPTGEPDPSQIIDWGVNRIDADLAWDNDTNTGAGINVAVIDTGIDLDHPDLVVTQGVDCTKGPSCDRGGDGNDDNGHGTHVAGTIAALDNAIGMKGTAYDANLFAVKTLNKQGSGFLSDVIEGIEWAINHDADVINMSLGTTNDILAFHDAVDAAESAGIVIVAAAGNNNSPGSNAPNYPAAYSSVIAVGATNAADALASFSTTGPQLELVAPGVDIESTWNNGGYNTISGTSMATPHVAGTAALVLSVSGGVSDSNGNGFVNDEVRDILTSTADQLGVEDRDDLYGYGLVDAEEAVTGTQTSP